MSRWHNLYIDGMVHFCTATVNEWQPLLDDAAATVLYRQWREAGKLLGVRVIAYVIMPNHIHMLLWSEKGESIRKFMQRVLSRSSKRIGAGGKFWKERLRVVCVYSIQVLRTKLDYIHANPVKRGLVQTPEEWIHSSFSQLELGCCSGVFTCDSWPDGVVVC
ncbi:MAG: REP-associated tyrosine transposase [Armatimonadota bacterium]